MKQSHNLSLIKYNTKNISEMNKHLGSYHWFSSASIFIILQISLVFFLFPNYWDIDKKLAAGLILIVVEISYFLLFIKIRKLLITNSIEQMFFQSIFLNIGMTLNLFLFSPFILSSYLKEMALFNYYLYGLLGVFILALMYTIQLDCKQLIANSLKCKDDGEMITFSPNNVFYPLNKCGSVIWLPHLIGLGYVFYGYILRSGEDSEYYMTVGMLMCSALFMYSEFCYFLLWIKYRFNKSVF